MVQWCAMSARTPRGGLLGPATMVEVAQAAGHDALVLADRGYVAGIPGALEAGARARLPVIAGVWVDITEAGAPVDRRGPPRGSPGDVLCWAKDDAGLEAIVDLSTHAMCEGRNGVAGKARIQALEAEGVGVLGTCTQALDVLEGRAEAAGVCVGGEAAGQQGDRRDSAHAGRRWAHDAGIPAIAVQPWVAATEDGRDTVAVLAATARRSTWEAESKRLNATVGVQLRSWLVEHDGDALELQRNAGALATWCCAGTTADRAVPTRAGSKEGEDQRALEAAANEGLEQRLKHAGAEARERYARRLQEELQIIAQTRFAAYFLTVRDLVQWEQRNGTLTGPARGSAAGSLVSWALGITTPDPLHHDLLFSRFLSTDRSVAPDFDLDFEPARRDAVKARLKETWGAGRTAPVCAWSGFEPQRTVEESRWPKGTSKAAVRAALKAKGTPEPGIRTAIAALEDDGGESLKGRAKRETEEAVATARRMVEASNAVTRHASAIAITASPMAGRFALCAEEGEEPAIQMDHNEAEAAGAAKIDCLGLDTLDVIRRTREAAGIEDDPWDDGVHPEDAAAYRRLSSGQGTGIFQMEKPQVLRMAQDIGIDSAEDLRMIIAINRPGPMEHVPALIRRKSGEEAVEAPHPCLDGLLGETYGIVVYQEQAIRAAVLTAGLDASEADRLRRAISKKKPKEMEAFEERFKEGVKETHPETPEETREALWSMMKRQAGYAFNKAHSTGYTAVSRATARLREVAPAQFFAALVDNAAESGRYRQEDLQQRLRRIAVEGATEGLEFKPPHPARPRARSTVRLDGHTIDTGLGLVEGAGAAMAKRWGEAGDDPERRDWEKAREWMEGLGLTPKVIETVHALHTDADAWPMQVDGRLPPREEAAAVRARGSVGTLHDAAHGEEETLGRCLVRIERMGRDSTWLADAWGRKQVECKGKVRTKVKTLQGGAAVVTLRRGSPPAVEGAVALEEAEGKWPSYMEVATPAAKAGRAEAVAKAMGRGHGTIRIGETMLRGKVGEELERATRMALEPMAAEDRIRRRGDDYGGEGTARCAEGTVSGEAASAG